MRQWHGLSVLALCGCSRLIGLDEFEYRTDPHSGGSGGVEVAGSAGVGGAGAGTSGGAGSDAGGSAGEGGAGAGGASGAGGAGGASGATGMGGASGAAGMGGASGAAGGDPGGAGGTTGAAGTGGAGTGGTGGTGSTCDTTADPTNEPCLVNETYGVFVSGDGSDTTGDGTRAAPYGTINKALDEALAAGKQVYACHDHGTYTTPVHYRAEHSGVNAYGHFTCDLWTVPDKNLKAVVAPTAPEPALTMVGLTGTTTVRGFRFEVADATMPGASSIAAVVEDSAGVTLLYVNLRSGKGASGGSATPAPFTFPDGILLAGSDADPSSPGSSVTFTACPGGGTTVGGAGGDTTPSSPQSGSPALGAGEAGDVGQSSCAAGLGGGAKGANGPNGGAGLGATTQGALIGNQWVPQAGAAGDPGGIAQGGGGGRGSTAGSGGGGAPGGCGGAGGTGGLGGGASIALLALESDVRILAYSITTRDAGDGGSGSLGQDGMLGGVAGSGWQTPDGCPGGDGGQGGRGGPGGGGAGGVVIGVGWRGTEPFLDQGGMSMGFPGDAGIAVGNGNPGLPGYVNYTRELN